MALDPEIQRYVDDQIRAAIKMHRHDGVLTQNVYLNQIVDPYAGAFRIRWSEILNVNELTFGLIVETNGTTVVSPFFSNGNATPMNFEIASITIVSLDTTAGTITVKNNSNTVSTFPKGTTAGLVVGPVSIANRDFLAGDTLTVVSSSAGNARVMFNILLQNN